jgi:hypothetical protein
MELTLNIKHIAKNKSLHRSLHRSHSSMVLRNCCCSESRNTSNKAWWVMFPKDRNIMMNSYNSHAYNSRTVGTKCILLLEEITQKLYQMVNSEKPSWLLWPTKCEANLTQYFKQQGKTAPSPLHLPPLVVTCGTLVLVDLIKYLIFLLNHPKKSSKNNKTKIWRRKGKRKGRSHLSKERQRDMIYLIWSAFWHF